MNVTFSCKVLSRWAQLVTVFSRMFKFSRIVIYRAKSQRSGLEWGDLLILFNRNNCSLSVGVFSFSLIWESIAAQFLTFVRTESKTLVEKDSPSSRTTKSSFFSRSAHFGNVSPFLVGATNAFSELIHPFVKLPNCVLKQQPHILQFVQSPRLFRLSPSSRSRHRLCCRTATFTHFWSSTIYTTFQYIHYISQGSNAKYWITASIITRESIKFTKRAELRTDFWQLDDIFEPPGRNELIVWKTDSRFFFSRLTRPTGV